MDVSAIIVNWNTRHLLKDCLRSVYEQTQDISFEVIVIDNASTDGSVKMVKREFPHIVLIENDRNCGFAAACNQGLRIAKGRYSLLLNSDTVILNGALQKSVRYADGHANVGVLSCNVVWPDGRYQGTCFRFPSLLNITLGSVLVFRGLPLFARPFWHRERYRDSDFDREQDVDVVAGCFFLMRREVMNHVGLLDEDFFMYGEEAEWCYRIRKAGWRVVYYPGASIIHILGASSNRVSAEMVLRKRRAQLLFLHKTKGGLYAWAGNVLMTVGVALRTPLWIFAEVFNAMRKHSRPSLLVVRVKIIGFHVAGLLWPVWR